MRVVPSRSLGAVATIAMLSLLLTGCTGGGGQSQGSDVTPAAPSGSSAETGAGAEVPNGPIGSVTVPAPPADGFEAKVLATGLDAGSAYFLSQTQSTVDVVDGHTFVVRHQFANGATGESTYHLFAPTDMSPSDPPVFTGDVVGDSFVYSLTYAVDTTGMPEPMRAQIAAGLPTQPPTGAGSTPTPASGAGHEAAVAPLGLARHAGAVRVADDGLAHTIGVLVDGVISQAQETGVDQLAAGAKERGLGTAPGTSWDAFKAGKKVWEAIDANDVIAKALAELDELEACAKNPTNALTRKEYERDPAGRQQALDIVADARSEIRQNAAVLFTSLVADTASGLAAEMPWLGFLVSPAVNYVKDTLLSLINSELDRARAAVVPCRSYVITGRLGSTPETTFKGCMPALGKRFTVKARGGNIVTLEYTPSSDTAGRWTWDGQVGNAPMPEQGKGSYTVELSPDATSGTITSTGSVTTNRLVSIYTQGVEWTMAMKSVGGC